MSVWQIFIRYLIVIALAATAAMTFEAQGYSVNLAIMVGALVLLAGRILFHRTFDFRPH